MIKKVYSLIKTIFDHPYNKKFPMFALFRAFKWQVQKALYGEKPIFQCYWYNMRIISWKDSFQSMWLNYNYYMDWKEFYLIARFLNKNSIVFDIGANIGIYSLWISHVTNRRAAIYSFEPHPFTFKRYKAQIELNNLTNIKANNIALSNTNGSITFTNSKDDRNHIITDQNSTSNISVDSLTLDTYCLQHNIKEIDFLKIDVEGAEILVLTGGINMLKEHRIHLIQFELNYEIDKYNFSKQTVLQLLIECGYQIYDYDIRENCFNEIIENNTNQQNIYALYDRQKIEKTLTNADITHLRS